MSATDALTLSKEERICSKLLIDKLFKGNASFSMSAFPLRVVCLKQERNNHEPQDMMLVSVPKRYFKRAVKRNRVKRQVREAFRKNKSLLLDKMCEDENSQIAVAFIWLDDKLYDTAFVENRVKSLLHRISEKL